MIPSELAERIREVIARGCSFSIEMNGTEGRIHHWKVTEHGRLDAQKEKPQNGPNVKSNSSPVNAMK